ncbi:MAG: HAD family hydrolase, partial [Akkermansiaceae bacterium]
MPETTESRAASSGYALFDLDQTLIPWDTQLLFCNFVLKRQPWRRIYLLILVPFLPFSKLLGAGGMKRVFLNYLVGMDQGELDALADSEFSATEISEP